MSGSIIPDYLHQLSIPTPFPVGPVNVYLAEGERLTLIDTGPRYEPAREALRKQLDELGYRVAHLRLIVLTHTHADHYGLAAELAAESGAEVWTYAENVDRMSASGNEQRLAFYARLLRWAGVPLTVMMELDLVNTFLAISEVVGHLQWLECEGKVSHIDRGGTARWTRVE
jgi:glyoxylase-like metal-dependent hydrolase (beta-lactamase superfamily II)